MIWLRDAEVNVLWEGDTKLFFDLQRTAVPHVPLGSTMLADRTTCKCENQFGLDIWPRSGGFESNSIKSVNISLTIFPEIQTNESKNPNWINDEKSL